MRPEAPKLLWDARDAAARVRDFTAGKDFEDYARDAMLRSAVERQLEIVGEALGRLAKVDDTTAPFRSGCPLLERNRRANRQDRPGGCRMSLRDGA